MAAPEQKPGRRKSPGTKAENRTPRVDAIGPDEIAWWGESHLSMRTKQFDPQGRLLFDQHKRWQADSVTKILRQLFQLDGVVPPRDQLADSHLIHMVYSSSTKPLPSADTILRAAGRKPRK
jgi:hypothetical protein